MQQLNVTECKNALIFLERVDLKGKESLPHAELMIKIGSIKHDLENPPKPPPKDPVDPHAGDTGDGEKPPHGKK